jgi:hypothetical protein
VFHPLVQVPLLQVVIMPQVDCSDQQGLHLYHNPLEAACTEEVCTAAEEEEVCTEEAMEWEVCMEVECTEEWAEEWAACMEAWEHKVEICKVALS